MLRPSVRAPIVALFAVWTGLAPFAPQCRAAKEPPDIRPDRLEQRVRNAFEAGDAASLGRLFPSDLPIRTSLERIADLQGYVGAGSLVEALRRYLEARSDVRFEPEAEQTTSDGAIRVRGTLSSRSPTGRREKVRLHFTFEKDRGHWRAMEIRETG